MSQNQRKYGLERFGLQSNREFSSEEEWEWAGMPKYISDKHRNGIKVIMVHFETQNDVDKFAEIIGQEITDRTRSIWYPAKPKENILKYLYVNECNCNE